MPSQRDVTVIQAILDLCADNEIELVSYGLAPNPNGFCYEAPDEVEDSVHEQLSNMLDALTSKQEQLLKKEVFG